jgi:hypothetical protein
MFDLPRPHQVIDRVAVQEQIVGDDPTMASPPDRLRPHQCQATRLAEAQQFLEGIANSSLSA